MRRPLLLVSTLALAACDAVFDIHGKTDSLAPQVDASTANGGDPVDAVQDSGSPEAQSPATPRARPPSRPPATSGNTESEIAFAARRYYFGAIDPRTGATDYAAWQRIGFDMDGAETTESLALSEHPGTCRRHTSSQPDVLLDGEDGRDNNFGSQIVRLAGDYGASRESLELGAADGIEAWVPTFIVVLSGLSDGPDDAEVTVSVEASVSVVKTPWEAVTSLPVDGRTVVPGTVEAKLRFERAYMRGHVVVAGGVHEPPPAPVLFPFDRQARPIVTNPLAFVMTFELDSGHTHVVRSTLASVMNLADVVAMFTPAAVRWGVASCDPGGQALVHLALNPLVDLRSDRPGFHDPLGESDCDAISMAIEVDWHPIRVPEIADVRDIPPAAGDCG